MSKNNNHDLKKSIEQNPIRQIKNTNYCVSYRGDVYNIKTLRRLTPQLMITSGYLYVPIYIDGKRVNKYIHILVAQAFVEKPYQSKNLVVDHIDKDSFNNEAYNLRWLTRRQNLKRERREYKKHTPFDSDMLQKAFKHGLSTSKIMDLFNISASTVYRYKRTYKAQQKPLLKITVKPYIC